MSAATYANELTAGANPKKFINKYIETATTQRIGVNAIPIARLLISVLCSKVLSLTLSSAS